ncbi:TonB-dependent vitamin B12 receptor BtuB [Dickeya chrysanthemi]|uniref:Vitamin B12 transporter BtuB n=1 Tax=Dickeya chrysanthemi TaxID=556 RepID=A0ABU8JNW5_DICCH
MFNKKITMLAAMIATAFSGWAQGSDNTQQNNNDAMVVTANRFPQPISSVLAPTTVVTRDDIDRWQSKSLTDVMRRLPGVDIGQNGGRGQLASVFIRGTESRHILVLIDGIRMASPGVTGTTDFSQIPMSIIQRIEYIRGARSAVYGSEAIGGVINIITTRTQDGGVLNAGYGSHAYQQYDGSIKQHIGENTAVSLAGGYEGTHGFNVYPGSTIAGDDQKSGYRSKTFWGMVEHQFTPQLNGFVRDYGYDNLTDYNKIYSDSSSNRRYLSSRSYDTGLQFQQGIYAGQLVASYQTYDDQNYDDAVGRYSNSVTRINQRSLQWGNVFSVGQGSISTGVDWRDERAAAGGASVLSESQSRTNTGLYLTTQQRIGQFTLEGAVRGDDNQQYGRHGTWQTAAGWEFIDGYRLTGSYGTAFKAPTFNQIYNTGDANFYTVGNTSLKPEESKQWEFGLEGISGPVNWRASTYRNDINNLIEYDGASNPTSPTYLNVAKAVIKGVEFTASYDTGPVTHHATLEYMDARNAETQAVLERRAHKKAKYSIDMAVADVDWSLAWIYQGARADKKYNEFPSDPVKLGGYSTWDLSAAYPVTSHLTVRARIANLFDKNYETVYGYRTAGREYYLTGSYSF